MIVRISRIQYFRNNFSVRYRKENVKCLAQWNWEVESLSSNLFFPMTRMSPFSNFILRPHRFSNSTWKTFSNIYMKFLYVFIYLQLHIEGRDKTRHSPILPIVTPIWTSFSSRLFLSSRSVPSGRAYFSATFFHSTLDPLYQGQYLLSLSFSYFFSIQEEKGFQACTTIWWIREKHLRSRCFFFQPAPSGTCRLSLQTIFFFAEITFSFLYYFGTIHETQ